MSSQIDLNQIADQIETMKNAVENLSRFRENFPALDRNTRRIMASIKMLEINVSDIIDLEG